MSENNEEKKISEEKEREPETVKENVPEKEMPEATNVSEQKEVVGKEEDTVGALLRRTRLAKNEDLQDVASYLCIRYQFLAALEEGDYKKLPGEAYANGFIRSYAAYLGLNPADILSRYKQEFFNMKNRENGFNVMSSDDTENVVPTPKIVVVSVILLLIAFGFWRSYFEMPSEIKENSVPEQDGQISYLPSEEKLSEKQTENAALNALSAPVPPVPSVKPEYSETTEAGKSETSDIKAVTAETETEKAEEKTETKVEENTEESAEAKPAKTEEKNTEYVFHEPRIYGQKNYNPRLVLMAKEDVWVQIKRGNTVVFSRLLNRGDQYMVSSKNPEELFLKTGNAGGLEIYCDGNLTQSLGPRGVMRSDIALIPDEFAAKVVEEIE